MGNERKSSGHGFETEGLVSPKAGEAKEAAFGADGSVTVMTQNLYIGGDIFVPLSDPGNFEELAFLTLRMMLDSRLPERTLALARIIARKKPDVVGLQEVYTLTLNFPGLSPQYNQTIHSRRILMDALSILGAEYRVAVTVEESSISIPMPSSKGSVRIVDSDVILVGKNVQIANVEGRNYGQHYDVPIGPKFTIPFIRGFAAIDARVKGKNCRFVSTHLENLGSPTPSGDEVQLRQAEELLKELGNVVLPVILVGDFNATPEDCPSAYTMIREAGYTDMWLRKSNGTGTVGYTCCQDPDLRNEASALSQRIDHIFVSEKIGSVKSSGTEPVEAYLVGNKEDDRTLSGLWPSDHAGLLAQFSI